MSNSPPQTRATRPVRSTGRRAEAATLSAAILGAALACFAPAGADAKQVGLKPYWIPSSSMSPTLEVGDMIYVTASDTVARGDVIVFALPRDPSVTYIKRVIALPGDRVRLRGGDVVLNGKTLKRTALGACTVGVGTDLSTPATCFDEHQPGGRDYRIARLAHPAPIDDTPVYVVPHGKLFVMGDNRDDSLDSRYMHDVGFVPLDNVRGVARAIYWSRDLSRVFSRIE